MGIFWHVLFTWVFHKSNRALMKDRFCFKMRFLYDFLVWWKKERKKDKTKTSLVALMSSVTAIRLMCSGSCWPWSCKIVLDLWINRICPASSQRILPETLASSISSIQTSNLPSSPVLPVCKNPFGQYKTRLHLNVAYQIVEVRPDRRLYRTYAKRIRHEHYCVSD